MLLSALLAACNPNYDMIGMIDGTSPEIAQRFVDSRHYSDSVGVVHMPMPEDYRLFVCTDSHIDTTHKGLEKFIRTYAADTFPHIALHLGDLINGQGHFAHADSILHLDGVMSSRTDTIFLTCGNHDIYFNQWHIWQQYYGSSVYWFDTYKAGTSYAKENLLDLYICLDTSEGTLGTAQMKWLRTLLQEKKDAGYRRIIVFTHTHLFKQDNSQGHTSNMALEETYELVGLLSEFGVEYYLCGHDHSREVSPFGSKYIIVDGCADEEPNPFYMVMEVGEDVNYKYVSLLPLDE